MNLTRTLTCLAAPFAAAVLALAPVGAASSRADAAPAATSTSHAAAHCARTLDSYPTLEPGARRAAVRTLQCALDDLGAHVSVDGYYGPQTRAAVKHIEDGFEGERPHPGRIDAGFWTLLYGRQLPSRVLRQGDHGPAVRTLQRALRAAGGEVVVDGRFGPQTRDLVKSYQRAHHDRVTGTMNRDVVFMLAMGSVF